MKSLQSIKIAAVVASCAFALGAVAQTTNTTAAGSSESLGAHISDGTITTKVKAELLGAKDVKAEHIHVKTRNGVVWLTGTVPSSSDRSRAQEVVRGVSGVQMVKNRLKVTEEGSD